MCIVRLINSPIYIYVYHYFNTFLEFIFKLYGIIEQIENVLWIICREMLHSLRSIFDNELDLFYFLRNDDLRECQNTINDAVSRKSSS